MRLACRYAAALLAFPALVAAGCGHDAPLVKADSAEATKASASAKRAILGGAGVAAKVLDGRGPLAVRQDVLCRVWQNNWKIQDPYRATCETTVTTAYAVRRPSLHDLFRIQRVLNKAGWLSDEQATWMLTGGRGYADLTDPQAKRFQLKDVDGASFTGTADDRLGVNFVRPETPLPAPEVRPSTYPGAGNYDSRTSGPDWQAARRDDPDRPYVLVVSGYATVAKQDW